MATLPTHESYLTIWRRGALTMWTSWQAAYRVSRSHVRADSASRLGERRDDARPTTRERTSGTAFCSGKRVKTKGRFGQNVPDLAGWNDGAVLVGLQEGLRRLGFVTEARILGAYDYGVPQHRSRLFLVAVTRFERCSGPMHCGAVTPSAMRSVIFLRFKETSAAKFLTTRDPDLGAPALATAWLNADERAYQ